MNQPLANAPGSKKVDTALLLTCLSGLILLNSACSVAPSEINWSPGSFEEIQVKALDSDRNILVYLSADWCAYCAYMNDNVLVDTEVIKYIDSRFLAYKAMDGTADGAIIGSFYRSSSYPTFLILSPDGSEIDRVVGKREVDDFLNILKIAHTGEFTLDYYLEELKKEPEDPVLLTRVFTKYVDRKDTNSALRYLRRIEFAAPDYYEQNRGCLMGTLARAEQ